MKKSLSILVCLCLISGVVFAKHSPKKMKQKSIAAKTKNSNQAVGRECCTKEYEGPNGSTVSITACAGWFLSNSDAAEERACAKVDAAAGDLIPQNQE